MQSADDFVILQRQLPSLTCIIPTLGRGKILCDIIGMLLDQQSPPYEIIVVDQSSQHDEKTRQILNEWHLSGYIQWLFQVEPNASLARNRGAATATGEILLFLDDDIRIRSDFTQIYMAAFADKSVMGVAGQILEGIGRTTDIRRCDSASSPTEWLHFPKNYSRRCETSWMASGNVGVRRELFLQLGGMDSNFEKGAYREESDFAMRFRRAGYRFRFEPAASIFHLGNAEAPEGGSRSWIRNKRIAGWHHCVGDWYFIVTHANGRNAVAILCASLRHFVFNRYNVARPWLIPILMARWLAALPIALMRRIQGARLIGS